jgi:hypothetical protein
LSSKKINTIPQNYALIAKLIEECYQEENTDNRIQILYKIDSLLPEIHRIKIPSLITNDYIDTALYRIEESISNTALPIYAQPHDSINNKKSNIL